MTAPTKTQLQIAQELNRRGCKEKLTRQDEYLKLADPVNTTIWVGRRGEIRTGDRLSTSLVANWAELKREAKENYEED